MRQDLVVRFVTGTLVRLAPASYRASLAGDLLEELTFRERLHSPRAARWWLVRQWARSMPPLLGAAMARTRWLSTVVCAFLAYVAVGVAEYLVNWALSGTAAGGGAYRPLGMLLTFPAVVLIACAAAWYRRGAAWVLAAAMLLAVTVMTLTSSEDVPAAYRVAYFIVGPAAVALGAALHRRLRAILVRP